MNARNKTVTVMTKLLRICCLVATIQITTIHMSEAFQNSVCVVGKTRDRSPLGDYLPIPFNGGIAQDESSSVTTKRRCRFSLFSKPTTSSSSSSLLEGKLSILQDVVKEMDARNKQIQEQLETAEQDYQQTLQALETELEETNKITGIRGETIQSLNDELKEMEDLHAGAFERLETTKDQEHERQTNELLVRSTDSLEKSKAEYTDRIGQLQNQLESKEKEIEEMVNKLAAKDRESNEIIDGLRNDVAKQKEEQSDLETQKIEQEEEIQTEKLERATLEIENLKAEHKQVVEEVRNEESERAAREIESLKAEHQKIVEDIRKEESQRATRDIEILKAEHQWITKDIRNEASKQAAQEIESFKAEHKQTVEDVRNEEFQRVTHEIENLKAKHKKVVEDYKLQIDKITSERDELSAELKEISAGSEEQVEIATAAVKAREKREERIRKESDQLAQKLKQSRLQVKIMRWAMDGVAEENREFLDYTREFSSEREELQGELEAALNQIAKLEEEKQRSLWQRLRDRFSRRGNAKIESISKQ
mmetsp:Transcript_19123/g.39299  ORF Transcript_19123/g.39299 Transcript_19123/m.39299 type:complete len:537 (-) Transcript_19123:42-1652(-)